MDEKTLADLRRDKAALERTIKELLNNFCSMYGVEATGVYTTDDHIDGQPVTINKVYVSVRI